MPTALVLRATRDFAAYNAAVRLAAGDILDFGDPEVQRFVRSALGWDAFAIEFHDLSAAAPSASDLAALVADRDAAQVAFDAADAIAQQASKAYAEDQQALITLDSQWQTTIDAADKAGIERPDDTPYNAERGRIKARIAGSQSAVATAANTTSTAAARLGGLIMRVRAATAAPAASDELAAARQQIAALTDQLGKALSATAGGAADRGISDAAGGVGRSAPATTDADAATPADATSGLAALPETERYRDGLARAGITTVGQLAKAAVADLILVDGIGTARAAKFIAAAQAIAG